MTENSLVLAETAQFEDAPLVLNCLAEIAVLKGHQQHHGDTSHHAIVEGSDNAVELKTILWHIVLYVIPKYCLEKKNLSGHPIFFRILQ